MYVNCNHLAFLSWALTFFVLNVHAFRLACSSKYSHVVDDSTVVQGDCCI